MSDHPEGEAAMTHPRITCMTCGRALTPGGPVCCPKPIADATQTEARPDACCGKCPSIVSGGFDCACEGNPRCVKAAYPALHSWATGSSVEGPVLAEDARRLLDTLGGDGKPACDRDHADEWVEVDEAVWDDLPVGARSLREWVVGVFDGGRCFVHRDDLPDTDPRALIARELGPAKADTFLGLLDEHGWTVTRKEER